MRRLIGLVALVLLVVPASLWAQRGGGVGRASAGGHGGMAARGGMMSHAGSGRASGGIRSSPGVGARGFSRGPTFRQPLRSQGFQPFRGSRIRAFNFRNCIGCRRGFGYPWGYAGLYDPYWWWDSGSSYDQDREREIAEANEMNQQSLEQQRARGGQDQDVYARPDAQPRAEERADASPATVLVFRDQRKQEIRNYAIVGQTLWSFAPQRTQKIPLADLDLAATTKANDERGVDFKVPAAGEGQ